MAEKINWKKEWHIIAWPMVFLIILSLIIRFVPESPKTVYPKKKKLDPVLAELADKFSETFKDLKPKLNINTNKNGSLFIGYKVRSYQVHGRSMSGEVTDRAYEQNGPAYGGFLLKFIRSGPAKNGLRQIGLLPEMRRDFYWYTVNNSYPYRKGKNYTFKLYFQNGIKKDIMEKIAKLLKQPKVMEAYNFYILEKPI